MAYPVLYMWVLISKAGRYRQFDIGIDIDCDISIHQYISASSYTRDQRSVYRDDTPHYLSSEVLAQSRPAWIQSGPKQAMSI